MKETNYSERKIEIKKNDLLIFTEVLVMLPWLKEKIGIGSNNSSIFLISIPGFAEPIRPEIWNPITIDEASTTNKSIKLIGVLIKWNRPIHPLNFARQPADQTRITYSDAKNINKQISYRKKPNPTFSRKNFSFKFTT